MWAQIINTLIGIWLMGSPAILHYNEAGADSNYIAAPLIATVAMVACWEVTRGLRKVNILFGIWLLSAPLILGYEDPFPIINDMACGSVIIMLASVRGKITGSYGGGWSALWQNKKD